MRRQHGALFSQPNSFGGRHGHLVMRQPWQRGPVVRAAAHGLPELRQLLLKELHDVFLKFAGNQGGCHDVKASGHHPKYHSTLWEALEEYDGLLGGGPHDLSRFVAGLGER